MAPSSLIVRGTREERFKWTWFDLEAEGEYEIPGLESLVQKLPTGELVWHAPDVWIEHILDEDSKGQTPSCTDRHVAPPIKQAERPSFSVSRCFAARGGM